MPVTAPATRTTSFTTVDEEAMKFLPNKAKAENARGRRQKGQHNINFELEDSRESVAATVTEVPSDEKKAFGEVSYEQLVKEMEHASSLAIIDRLSRCLGMILRLLSAGDAVNALQLFGNMFTENGIEIDGLDLVSVLQACSFVGYVSYGRSVHGHVFQRGFEADLFISNSLVAMYSKCFHMSSAYMFLIQMTQTNLVTWNSILSSLVENEKHVEAILLPESMKKPGVEGDPYTAVFLLQACKMLGLEAFCRSIHALIIRRLFELNNFVLNSLLDAYAKCKLMELALRFFRQMPSQDMISWSTMIFGFSHYGQPHRVFAFFIQMRLRTYKIFDLGGLLMFSTRTSLSMMRLDGLEFF
ncbi:hypothetical protein IEQ34_009584 [Dendrobium chrysotoxum]|uniref:Pentatricopeptide repeat-containing protein n=1 Tax=Dendrobium chrysotoxum TaxID=161865 RepID=A0AAV7H1S5_DENCH|nr:hypothetical protein IEQ34_009584 [Dendrobium chrysotoxum]